MTTENIATVAEVQEATLNMRTITEEVKSTATTLVDQYGDTRKTMVGREKDASDQLDVFQDNLDIALSSAGYQIIGDFSDAVKAEITSPNQRYTSRDVVNFEDYVWRYTGALPYTPTESTPIGNDWVATSIGELETIARSLNIPKENIIYGTVGASIPANITHIYVSEQQTTYSKPADVTDGAVIVSIVDDVLSVQGGETYILTSTLSVNVNSIDALAKSKTFYNTVTLTENGRHGVFRFNSADLSTLVALDTQQGLYVAPESDPTGASGAWVRDTNEVYKMTLFGVAEGADNGEVINYAVTLLNALYNIDGVPRYLQNDCKFDVQSSTKIMLNDGVYLVNDGTLTYTGDETEGTFILIRSSTDSGITSTIVGKLDGGSALNINGIGVSGRDDLGGESRRILITDQEIKNCRSNHTSITEIGEQGGKGLSIQTGPREVFVDNIFIRDCDIGYSIESAISQDGKTGVQIGTLRCKDCEWIGGIHWGAYSNEPDAGDYSDSQVSNIILEDCGKSVGVTDGFAPLVLNAAYQLNAVFKIRNKTGTGNYDIVRGSARFSKIQIMADVNTIRHCVNHEVYGGSAGADSAAKHNEFDVKLKVRATPASSGYLLRGANSQDVTGGKYHFYVNEYNGSDYEGSAGWTGSVYENIRESVSLLAIDGNKGVSLARRGPEFFQSADPITVADDSFTTYQLTNSFGFVGVAIQSATNRSAFVNFDVDGTLRCGGVVDGNIEFTTGALTGSTGADGVVTISVDSTGLLYVENRLGAPVPILIKQV